MTRTVPHQQSLQGFGRSNAGLKEIASGQNVLEAEMTLVRNERFMLLALSLS